MRRAQEVQRNQNVNRLSLLDMETQQSKNAPSIASPAAFGYGPALAMPTLTGMMPEMPSLDDSGGDTSLVSSLSLSPERRPQEGANRDSVALDMSNFGGAVPGSIAKIFPNTSMEGGGGSGFVQPQRPPSGSLLIFLL